MHGKRTVGTILETAKPKYLSMNRTGLLIIDCT